MTEEENKKLESALTDIFKKYEFTLISNTYKNTWKQVLSMLKSGKTKAQIISFGEYVLQNEKEVLDMFLEQKGGNK